MNDDIDVRTTAGKLADLERRIQEATHAGSERAVEKQHAKGKLTARERIALLLDEGYQVDSAADGDAGLARLGNGNGYDLVLLDLKMEGRSGLSVLEEMRRSGVSTPVIMLTGYGNIATAVAAVKAGAVDYLSKPADADDVARALLARKDEAPPPPENPMSADRVRWEHIQRVFEQCDRNVSETARRLKMHRRTLQRILSKHAPRS